MRTRPGRLLLVVAVAIGAGSVWAGFAWAVQDRSLERVRERGIRIGYAVEPPYAFLTEAGEVTGEAPEIARLVAKRLGIARVDWNVAEFGALLPELRAGRYDAVAAGMFVTPEREREVAFSLPTFRVRQALLVRGGNPLDLHSYPDAIARSDVRVAALDGSVEATLLRQMGLPESRLVLVPDARAGQRALQAALVDGVALSSPTVRWMELNDRLGATEAASPFTQPDPQFAAGLGYGAVAFRDDDAQLRRAWNRELGEVLGTPEHLALVERFGFTALEAAEATGTTGDR